MSAETDTLSTGSGSGDELSDVEFDEELDEKLKEEVERDLPRSITDLSKAERTNGLCSSPMHHWNSKS